MEMPTIPLTIEGFLPVIFSGLGMFFVARLIAQLDRHCGQLASLGFLLVLLGNLSNALWKLTLMRTELHIPVLHHMQWILLTPGLVLMAWATWKTFHSGPSGTPVWVVPVIVIVAGCGAAAVSALSKGGRRWFFILLGLMIVAQAATVILLLWQAWRRGLSMTASLLCFTLVTIGVQSALALRHEQSVIWQWIEQINSTLAWAAFAYAAWQLEQSVVRKRNEA